MSLDADHIVDRRRLRRKLTFWRVTAIVVAIAAIVGGTGDSTLRGGILPGQPGAATARITIEGLIRSSQQRVEALDRLGKSQVKAVILHINSPGGTVAGSEQLYDSLMQLRSKKPVVVVVDGLAA